jgi:DNA-binding transcriptional LysR family regulator
MVWQEKSHPDFSRGYRSDNRGGGRVELRQYRHVLVLANHASFRKVFEELGISRPALTKSLFQIEREVGHRLFDRHGQSVSPTVFVAIVADTARRMLDSQDVMTRAIGQTAALDAGELSVGAVAYAGAE